MIFLAAVPLVVALALRSCADQLARRLRPSLAVVLLTGLSLTVALCTGIVLSAIAVLVCAQLGPLPAVGGWSAPALRSMTGFPTALGIAALLTVLVCLTGAGVRAVRSVRSLTSAHRTVKLLQPTDGQLVLLRDQAPIAYSVAALHGRIVVSTAMLNALSAPERRVLIAHEAAHLRHRHHLFIHLARLAAAANPLLRPASAAVTRAVERWADEAAAAEVGDRQLAAHALAHAALAGSVRPPAQHALGAADDRVAERVRSLLAPAPVQRLAPIALVVGAGLLSWGAACATALWANNLMQIAESLYPHA